MSSSSEAASVLLFFCLFIIYAGTTAFCLIRILKLHKFSPEWRKAQYFYVQVLLQVALRAVCMLILSAQQKDLSSEIMFLLILTPDSLFLLSYVLLIWQLGSVYYFAHFEDQMKRTFLSRISRKSKTSCAGILLILGIVLFGASQAVLYLVALSGGIQTLEVSFEVDILNIVIPTTCVFIIVFLSVKYSGVPLKSVIWGQRLTHIFRVSVYWTATRLFRGLASLIGSFFGKGLTVNLEDDRETTEDYIMLIIILIISEILCVFSVQDFGFMGIFIFAEEEADVSVPPSRQSEVQDPENPLSTSISSLNQNESALIGLSDLQEGQEYKSKKQGLGKLFKAQYNDSPVMFRKIVLPRLSGYVIEELTSEIESNRRMRFNYVVPIIAVVIEMPVIGFVTPIMPLGSLFDVLHVQKTKLSLTNKVLIAEKISNELSSIHSQGKAHGHLTSHNILLDEAYTPYISDLGFVKVKKYAGIVSGYTNISAWSSPELLNDKRLTPIRCSASDDSYSFGMILWEMFAEQEPFPGFNRKQLVSNIVEMGHRPVVSGEVPDDIVDIIMKCWNPDAKQRPEMGVVSGVLDSYNRL